MTAHRLSDRAARPACLRTVPATGRHHAPRLPAVASLHTLGPAGTNCERAAFEWFAGQRRVGTVVLHDTLEAAAAAVASTPGAALMVPVAYPELHRLVYAHLETLELAASHITMTHNMVLARRPGTEALRTVATHPAPDQLVPAGCQILTAASTSKAATDCAAGLADACITTLPAMESSGLQLIHDFGPVAMAFTIHVRRSERSSS